LPHPPFRTNFHIRIFYHRIGCCAGRSPCGLRAHAFAPTPFARRSHSITTRQPAWWHIISAYADAALRSRYARGERGIRRASFRGSTSAHFAAASLCAYARCARAFLLSAASGLLHCLGARGNAIWQRDMRKILRCLLHFARSTHARSILPSAHALRRRAYLHALRIPDRRCRLSTRRSGGRARPPWRRCVLPRTRYVWARAPCCAASDTAPYTFMLRVFTAYVAVCLAAICARC